MLYGRELSSGTAHSEILSASSAGGSHAIEDARECIGEIDIGVRSLAAGAATPTTAASSAATPTTAASSAATPSDNDVTADTTNTAIVLNFKTNNYQRHNTSSPIAATTTTTTTTTTATANRSTSNATNKYCKLSGYTATNVIVHLVFTSTFILAVYTFGIVGRLNVNNLLRNSNYIMY